MRFTARSEAECASVVCGCLSCAARRWRARRERVAALRARSARARSPASSRIRPARPCRARPSPSPTSTTNRAARRRLERRRRLHRAEPGARRVPHRRRAVRASSRCGARASALSTGEKVRVDFDLAVGDVREQVTVTADAPIAARGDRQPRHGRRARAGRAAAAERPHASSRSRRWRPAWRCRPARSCRASTAAGRAPTSTCSTASRCCSPSRARSRSFPIIDAIQEFKIESNSPPAEFGRFNGGVINLTTQVGHERVPRRRLRVPPQRGAERAQLLSVDEPGEAGLPAQSVRRRARRADRRATAPSSSSTTRASGRRSAARSSRPCRRCCSGRASSPRRSAAACRSSTIRRRRSASVAHAVRRTTRFRRAAWIRWRSRCCSAIRCRPSAGTANNYRRTANEIDDQDQWDVRIDHRFASNRDQVFGRLSRFPRRLRAGDAAAGRQRRHDRHARSAGHDRVGVRVELPAHVLEQRAERAAHRRHAPDGRPHRGAARRRRPARRSSIPGIPSTAQFPEHAADVPRSAAISSSARRRTRPRTSARA